MRQKREVGNIVGVAFEDKVAAKTVRLLAGVAKFITQKRGVVKPQRIWRCKRRQRRGALGYAFFFCEVLANRLTVNPC